MTKPQSSLPLAADTAAKDIDPRHVLGIVQRVFALKGRKPDQETLVFTVNEMKQELAKNYYYLTAQEIQTALDNGVHGVYGEVFDISVCSLCKWLDAYCNSDQRRRYIESRRPKPVAAIAQRATYTETERIRDMRKIILARFEEYKQTGDYTDHGNIVYKFLNERGVVTPTTEEKWEVYNAELTKARQANAATAAKPRHIMSLSAHLAALEKSAEGQARNASMRHFVKKFFKSMLDNGVSLDDHIPDPDKNTAK